MSHEAPPDERRMVWVSEPFGQQLVELAKGKKESVAAYCDRELGGIVAERWRAMLADKLRAADPAFANALEGQ